MLRPRFVMAGQTHYLIILCLFFPSPVVFVCLCVQDYHGTANKEESPSRHEAHVLHYYGRGRVRGKGGEYV
jgi:hypothetical protein